MTTSPTLVFRIIVSAVALALTGCAGNRFEQRKEERQAAYAALPPNQKTLVDERKIDVGFDTNAVYIAWGPPAHVVRGHTDDSLIWIYRCNYAQERRGWRAREEYIDVRHGVTYPTLEYVPYFTGANYVCGEVIFEKGLVKLWRVFPRRG